MTPETPTKPCRGDFASPAPVAALRRAFGKHVTWIAERWNFHAHAIGIMLPALILTALVTG